MTACRVTRTAGNCQSSASRVRDQRALHTGSAAQQALGHEQGALADPDDVIAKLQQEVERGRREVVKWKEAACKAEEAARKAGDAAAQLHGKLMDTEADLQQSQQQLERSQAETVAKLQSLGEEHRAELNRVQLEMDTFFRTQLAAMVVRVKGKMDRNAEEAAAVIAAKCAQQSELLAEWQRSRDQSMEEHKRWQRQWDEMKEKEELIQQQSLRGCGRMLQGCSSD